MHHVEVLSRSPVQPYAMKATKGIALHVWIQDETSEQLAKLSDILDMNKSEIAARLIVAGMKTLSEAGNRMPLPLRFKLLDEPLPPETATKARSNTLRV